MSFESTAKEMLKDRMVFQDEKRIREYRLNSDSAFQKFAKRIGNDEHCYFELVQNGVYRLRPKWYPR